jgi:hypothetical protein
MALVYDRQSHIFGAFFLAFAFVSFLLLRESEIMDTRQLDQFDLLFDFVLIGHFLAWHFCAEGYLDA